MSVIFDTKIKCTKQDQRVNILLISELMLTRSDLKQAGYISFEYHPLYIT